MLGSQVVICHCERRQCEIPLVLAQLVLARFLLLTLPCSSLVLTCMQVCGQHAYCNVNPQQPITSQSLTGEAILEN